MAQGFQQQEFRRQEKDLRRRESDLAKELKKMGALKGRLAELEGALEKYKPRHSKDIEVTGECPASYKGEDLRKSVRSLREIPQVHGIAQAPRAMKKEEEI
jgi:hypothetical protein